MNAAGAANFKLLTSAAERHPKLMNFLVTGGAGFIGSHVCERLLHSGHAVWVLDDLNPFYSPAVKQKNIDEIASLGKPFTFALGELSNFKVLEDLFKEGKFDQVIHLA